MSSRTLIAGLVTAGLCAGGGAMAAATHSVWSGVYTGAQAVRGKVAYAAHCAACHGATLRGGSGPALAGKTFIYSWSGLSVNDLSHRIQSTMPADKPGSLSAKAAADLTAYILSVNEFPAGKAELPADAARLKAISIDGKRPS